MENEVTITYKEPVGEAVEVEVSLRKGNIQKKAIFPNTMIELKGSQDIVSVLYHHNNISENSPMIISLPFATDIRRKATFLENLPIRLRPSFSFDDLKKNHVMIADPCPEAFWLKRPELRNKFKEIPKVPSGFCDVFDEYETQTYAAWADAAARGDFANFTDALIRFEESFGFDFFVPPAPVVDVSTPSSPLYVNSYNVAVSKIMEKSKKDLPLLYNLTINSNVFSNYNNEVMENIKSYITEEFQLHKKRFHGLYVRVRGIDQLSSRKNYDDVKPYILEFLSWLGSLSKTFQVPVFLVKSGYYGYYALEKGIQAFSEPTSGDLGDIKDIKKGKSHPKKERLYGKTLIIDECIELNKKDFDNYIKKHGRLPKLKDLPDKPTDEQYKNPTLFRDHFSKPRRYETRKQEIKRLKKSMSKNELDAVEQYISRCENEELKKFIGLETKKNKIKA